MTSANFSASSVCIMSSLQTSLAESHVQPMMSLQSASFEGAAIGLPKPWQTANSNTAAKPPIVEPSRVDSTLEMSAGSIWSRSAAAGLGTVSPGLQVACPILPQLGHSMVFSAVKAPSTANKICSMALTPAPPWYIS